MNERSEITQRSTDERADKAERALATVEAFIKEQQISCAETVCQCDNVITNAYEFIEKLCDIAGYYEDEPPEPDGECYRGVEAASALAEEQAWIQRNLK